MDPVTHAVIGMAIAKATGGAVSLNEPSTIAVVAGSVFPDIDIVLQKWGDYVYLKNHRGVTHSIIGLVVSSALIAGAAGAFFNGSNFLSLFLWALLGCVSHVFFDLFNSYGAKVLWPFCKKKYTFSLLIIFDPVFIGILLAYIFMGGEAKGILLAAFAGYLILRALMRLSVLKRLKKKFDENTKISVLPSMTGLLRWHFVLESAENNVIGEVNVLKRGERIIQTLDKIQDVSLDRVLLSPLGEFFSEFTPLFHVACEKVDAVTRYVFIDMRYYMKNKFLHHAVLEIDENDSIITETFNPYSINRSSSISAN